MFVIAHNKIFYRRCALFLPSFPVHTIKFILSTVFFGEKNIDWVALTDLMTYAILGRIPHAPIEPFHYIANHYTQNTKTERIEFSAVYLNDPSKYVHLNEEGFVALTKEDLIARRFISDQINEIINLSQHPAYIEYLDKWKHYFIKPTECAFCQGWRVCLGKFSAIGSYSGCKDFFLELMEVIEQYWSIQKSKMEVWQP
jgi:hypothetical protein